MSGSIVSNRSNDGRFNRSTHQKIDINDDKRNANTVMSASRDKHAMSHVEVPTKSNKSRNQLYGKTSGT